MGVGGGEHNVDEVYDLLLQTIGAMELRTAEGYDPPPHYTGSELQGPEGVLPGLKPGPAFTRVVEEQREWNVRFPRGGEGELREHLRLKFPEHLE